MGLSDLAIIGFICYNYSAFMQGGKDNAFLFTTSPTLPVAMAATISMGTTKRTRMLSTCTRVMSTVCSELRGQSPALSSTTAQDVSRSSTSREGRGVWFQPAVEQLFKMESTEKYRLAVS